MKPGLAARLDFLEAIFFSAFVAFYIWRGQVSHPSVWIVFPVWLLASWLVHRDTPKTLGWRAGNLGAATRRAFYVFAVFIAALLLAGALLGGLHRALPAFSAHRFLSYLAFCLLQEVALQSLVMNRLLGAFRNHWLAALTAGIFFSALHWPNPVLVPLTLIGGAAMCWLFARERNIIPLAIGQAILGSLVWWVFPVAWHHGMRVGPGFHSFPH